MAPIGTLPFIVGKSLPYFGVSMLSAIGVVLASIVLFDLPVSAFAGTQPSDYIYMYQRWGNTDGSAGGFEETSLIAGITPVPEMSALFPIVGLMVAVGSTHILRRRQMAKASK